MVNDDLTRLGRPATSAKARTLSSPPLAFVTATFPVSSTVDSPPHTTNSSMSQRSPWFARKNAVLFETMRNQHGTTTAN